MGKNSVMLCVSTDFVRVVRQVFGEELSGDVMCVHRLVRAVRQVFGEELQTRSNSQCSTPLMPSDSPARFSPAQVSCFSVKGN